MKLSPPQPQQQRVSVDISKATDILCENCKDPYFLEVMRLKRLSAFISPTGREEILNLPTLLCAKCGTEYEAK
jgi:hypothetical protein